MHKEVATKEIMDCFRELAKVSIKLNYTKFQQSSYFINVENFLKQ